MRSMINRLYSGELYEAENLFQNRTARQIKKQDIEERAYNVLWEKLSDEQKKLFDDFLSKLMFNHCDEVELAYQRGFKVGAQLIIEVFDLDFDDENEDEI